MSLELATTLIAALLLIGLGVRLWADRKRRRTAAGSSEGPAAEDENLVDLNEKFLRQAVDANGNPRAKAGIVRSFGRIETAMLRSQLDAEGIPSYCDANTMGSLYPGASVEGISDEIILVFEEDREAARELAAAYIQDLRQGPGTANPLPELL